ncbi:9310_t:CDS:1, partial [Cetraspora pellucida]
KAKQRIIETPNEDPEPVIPQRIVLDTLVTYNYKKKKYVLILTKNGEITKRYPGGIFVQHLYGGHLEPRYVPVHRLPNHYLTY